ncbi:methyltransferase [Reyranella sp.]|uniref:methyltransferase n=1 Tax=Reyranella sp. TaxID=1929291 RepID=UPI003F6EFB20
MSWIRSILDQCRPSVACWTIVAAVLAGAAIGREPAVAVYLVSFVYYGLYWYAFAWGVDSFRVFKRDALLLKALSVAALAFVYLQVPPDFLSLGVIALGILLNARAAAVLGIDRTYYGQELAGLAARRITEFPYSLMSHPMIVGNVMAFGGTLLNPEFSATWWPLAALHVVLNLGLLAMERAGPRRRPAIRLAGLLVFAVTAATATVAIGNDSDLSRLTRETS